VPLPRVGSADLSQATRFTWKERDWKQEFAVSSEKLVIVLEINTAMREKEWIGKTKQWNYWL